MTDDLDDLLTPAGLSEASHTNRDALFLRTERRLAFARRTRQCVRVAGVAAVFALGVGLGWVAKPERAAPIPEPEVVVAPVAVPFPVPADSPGVLAEVPRSGRDLELLAEQSDDAAEVAKLYRSGGDAYLDAQDYGNAARCYRLFLARAGDTALSPVVGDTWLLTSLKNAAFKEKLDASKTDGD